MMPQKFQNYVSDQSFIEKYHALHIEWIALNSEQHKRTEHRFIGGKMKHFRRHIIAIFAIAIIVMIFLFFACAPNQHLTTAATSTITPVVTMIPKEAAIATPTPTPEPTPPPRVIEFSIERSLIGSTTGAEIMFHHLTYTKNHGMVLTLTISNHTDKYLYLLSPIYANVNGYGILFTVDDQYESFIESKPNLETQVFLSANLDETMDGMMNIEQIRSVQFDCNLAIRGDVFREISDEFINVDCPTDYVQSYSIKGDIANLFINPKNKNSGIGNDIQINSFYNDADKKIYLTLAGTNSKSDLTSGEAAYFGHAYLAVDGVLNPYDDDVYLPNGEEIYIPNNGYCVVSFDVSRIPGFDYQKNRLSCSFNMNYRYDDTTINLFSASLNADNNVVSKDFSDYINLGETLIDNDLFQFVYQGIRCDDGLNITFDGILINKMKFDTIAFGVDILINGSMIQILSDPVPPDSVLQLHSTHGFVFNTGGDIEVNICILDARGGPICETTKTIQLVSD